MAHSKPFLTGTILFSSISPDYEKNLKEELFGCFKYVGIPFDTLLRMPTKDRKFYIQKHNEYTERENARIEGKSGGSNITGDMINTYANIDQQNAENTMKR